MHCNRNSRPCVSKQVYIVVSVHVALSVVSLPVNFTKPNKSFQKRERNRQICVMLDIMWFRLKRKSRSCSTTKTRMCGGFRLSLSAVEKRQIPSNLFLHFISPILLACVHHHHQMVDQQRKHLPVSEMSYNICCWRNVTKRSQQSPINKNGHTCGRTRVRI